MKKDLRIVFMGTPDFAVPSLANLVDNGYNVVGVVTMPDKAIGRHHGTAIKSRQTICRKPQHPRSSAGKTERRGIPDGSE